MLSDEVLVDPVAGHRPRSRHSRCQRVSAEPVDALFGPRLVVVVVCGKVSLGGGGPSMKWM